MGRSFKWRALVLSGVASAFMVFGVSSALADDFHGIATAKQCTSPVKIGDPYTCSLQILNVVDIPANDTLRLTGFSDVVHSAGGNVATGNIMPTTGLVFSGAVACTGGSGAGTDADPYIGATSCLLPFEVLSLARHVTAGRVTLFFVNAAIVAYLLRHERTRRGA